MPWSTIIQLVAQVGLPVAQQLLQMYETVKTPGTSKDLQVLIEFGKWTSGDSLADQNIKIVDGKAVPAS